TRLIHKEQMDRKSNTGPSWMPVLHRKAHDSVHLSPYRIVDRDRVAEKPTRQRPRALQSRPGRDLPRTLYLLLIHMDGPVWWASRRATEAPAHLLRSAPIDLAIHQTLLMSK